jgi:hypothetical protein
MKTYVITLSKTFPAGHYRKGEPTSFHDKFLKRLKKHTVRGNYVFWKKRIDNINAGLAKLSVRGWMGRPYASKQYIIQELYKGEVGIQRININLKVYPPYVEVDGKLLQATPDVEDSIYFQDGLTLADWKEWFKSPLYNGCIIHWTDLRY